MTNAMPPDSEIKELMEEYDLDEDQAKKLKELVDELGIEAEDIAELIDEV